MIQKKSRDGTEKDEHTLKKTFVEIHKFDLDLELTEKVKKAEAKQGMNDFVKNAVSTNAKCIVLVVMSHGKTNDWYILNLFICLRKFTSGFNFLMERFNS